MKTNTEPKMEQFELNEKVEDFLPYKEILEKQKENTLRETPDLSLIFAASTLVLGISQAMVKINRVVIGNLTGLDLDSNEHLYDYLSKALDITAETVIRWSIILISEYDEDKLAEMFKEAFEDMGVKGKK